MLLVVRKTKPKRPTAGGAEKHFKGESETLVRRQIAPLPGWQLPQRHAAHADALEADHLEADLFAHAADLALLAFLEHEAQLLGVLPVHLRGLERLAVQAQAMAQAGQLFAREHGLHILADFALRALPDHAHQVFLFY